MRLAGASSAIHRRFIGVCPSMFVLLVLRQSYRSASM
jgi:hypothetical protein